MDVELIKKFAKFCKKKLGIKDLPKIKLTQERGEIKTTAGYRRGEEIIIYTKGRHQVDICRSIAHELKHHKQWEDKEFNDTEKIQDVGGKMEDEANAIAGQMIKQFAYSGNMNLYESRKILTEGRLEDAKKQFTTISPKLIEYISANDPSGNNKYLKWTLRQLRTKMLTIPDADQKSIVDDIIKKLGVFNRLLPYYSSKLLDPKVLTNKIIKSPKDINNYDTVELLDLTNSMIKPIYDQKEQTKEKLKSVDVVYDGDDYLVVRIKSFGEMIYYGKNTAWPLADPNINSKQYFDSYIKSNYFFAIISKIEQDNHRYNKFIISLSKKPNTDKYIQIFGNNDQLLSVEDFKQYDPKMDSIIRMMEMWIETLKDRPAHMVKFENPELYALSQYLGDDDLKHYKENPKRYIPTFNYNNGKTNETYYVGNIAAVKAAVKFHYIEQVVENPKILLRNLSELHRFIYLNKMVDLVLNYFGFDGLYIDHDKIKSYYTLPPMKLKTDNILENNSDLEELKQIEEKMGNYNMQIKQYEKAINLNDNNIKKHTKIVNGIKAKLEVFKIRADQLKDDTNRQNDIKFKIVDYTRALEFNEKELQKFLNTKKQFESVMEDEKQKLNELSDKYTEIINTIDQKHGDKANYEYSKEQIKDVKNKIQKNVLANPAEWVKKLKLGAEKMLEIINKDSFGDIMTNEFIKNVKSFGNHKLIADIEENNTKYYIFKDE